MNREKYKKSEDYQKSLLLINCFVRTILDGKIEKLKDFVLDDLKNKDYIGAINDPDMYLITQAIYIVLWGHVWNLSFSNMGSWGKTKDRQFPYRGDTINAFGKIGEKDGKPFAYRAKYFEIEKNEMLWDKIEQFYATYHRIGNFIIIPNRGGLNILKANWRNGMRDYFDWFLITLFNYQQRCLNHSEKVISDFDDAFKSRESFEECLKMNEEYSPTYLQVKDWNEIFYLDDFFTNGIPEKLFMTSPRDRLKITTAKENRKNLESYFNDNEYALLLNEYIERSVKFIDCRGQIMVSELEKALKENC